ncbi:MAG: DNA-binding response OmpR family regulator [Gammaproteobacteria bacterium]|jgi:DNA-binding response OmpR family regulator
MKILIIEDSLKLLKALKVGLTRFGYAVDAVSNGEEGVIYALNYDYDVVVLDSMLPKKSGMEVLNEIRQSRKSPGVLILSARDQVSDKIDGLEKGADDYQAKPFSLDELRARIQAIVRRKFNHKSPILKLGDIKLDMSLHIAFYSDVALSLTMTEVPLSVKYS